MKNPKEPEQGVWVKGWASFLAERAMPESEKYLVLVTWDDEEEQGHSCRYPVRATCREDAVKFVKDHDKWHQLFTGKDNVEFQALLVEDVPKRQLDYLGRRTY
jgi:hypothetical protein